MAFGMSVRMFAAAAVAMGLGAAAGSAGAASCSVSAVSITSTGAASATACYGAESGNDKGAQNALLPGLEDGSIFNLKNVAGGATWTLVGASDDDGFLDAPKTKSGVWTLDADKGLTGTFVVSLKGGPQFSAFLFENTPFVVTGGTFDNTLAGLRVGRGNTPGLSHLTVYAYGSSETTPIPLPAAAWLLLAGVGGLGALGWRKRRAAA